MQKKSSVLENATAYFQNLAIDYSADDDIVQCIIYILSLRKLSSEEFRKS